MSLLERLVGVTKEDDLRMFIEKPRTDAFRGAFRAHDMMDKKSATCQHQNFRFLQMIETRDTEVIVSEDRRHRTDFLKFGKNPARADVAPVQNVINSGKMVRN